MALLAPWETGHFAGGCLADLTNRGEIVIDPFLDSGSCLIAAEKTGRICRGVELDPLYVDVIVRRYQLTTGNDAVLIETGETFEALAARSHRVRLGRPFVWPVRFLTALDRSRAPADLSGFCEFLAAPHKIRC